MSEISSRNKGMVTTRIGYSNGVHTTCRILYFKNPGELASDHPYGGNVRSSSSGRNRTAKKRSVRMIRFFKDFRMAWKHSTLVDKYIAVLLTITTIVALIDHSGII